MDYSDREDSLRLIIKVTYFATLNVCKGNQVGVMDGFAGNGATNACYAAGVPGIPDASRDVRIWPFGLTVRGAPVCVALSALEAFNRFSAAMRLAGHGESGVWGWRSSLPS